MLHLKSAMDYLSLRFQKTNELSGISYVMGMNTSNDLMKRFQRIKSAMINRCHGPNHEYPYCNYGDRGIFVCDEMRSYLQCFKIKNP